MDLVEDASGAELKPALRENVSIETTAYSDTLASYQGLDEELAGHETISHRAGEYVPGSATLNGIEVYWANTKERLLRPPGVANEHFLLYLKGTEYRFNRRHLDQEELVNHLLEHVLLPYSLVRDPHNALEIARSHFKDPPLHPRTSCCI